MACDSDKGSDFHEKSIDVLLLVRGLGDTTVSILNLQWAELKLGEVSIWQRVVFDLVLPTGQYNRHSLLNLNSNTYAFNPHYEITILLAKHWETSWRIHYLWNSENDDPPLATGLNSIQAGQAIHFNATLGYEVTHNFWVGANGYYLRQITDPYVNGTQLHGSPEQIGAIGPGALWDCGDFLFYANAYHELGAINRPEGNRFVLRISWVRGRKTK